MKKFTPSLLLIAGIIFLVVANACKRRATRNAAPALSSIKSTAQARLLVPIGMTTNELLAKIGPPPSEWVFGQADELQWMYALTPFPADDDMRGTYVTTLSVWITNSKVARVSFGYQGGPIDTISRQEISKPITTTGYVTLDLFVVRTNAHPGERFIDTPLLPKLGYIATQPDLSVRKLEELDLEEQVQTDSEGKKRTNWVFVITLASEDGRRFAELTSTNLLKRLLITVAGEPIVAPMVIDRIEGGRLQIAGADAQRDYIKSNLAKMKR